MSLSGLDIASSLNLTGAQLEGCSVDGKVYDALAGMQAVSGTTITLEPDTHVKLAGVCSGITIVANGGTLELESNARLNDAFVQGEKTLTVVAGTDSKVTNLHGPGTYFVDFVCGDRVSFKDCNLDNAVFSMCSHMGQGVTFEKCSFKGAHLNCSIAEASLIGCSFSHESKLAEAGLENCRLANCTITDEKGKESFVGTLAQLECCGVNSQAPCELTGHAQAQMIMQNLSGLCGGEHVCANDISLQSLPAQMAQQSQGRASGGGIGF